MDNYIILREECLFEFNIVLNFFEKYIYFFFRHQASVQLRKNDKSSECLPVAVSFIHSRYE